MNSVKMENFQLKKTFAHQLHHKVESKVVLTKAHSIKLKSAVGIVISDGKMLLGLAKTNDERDGKWCFPGGGIDEGEVALSAAVREVYEEMGISTNPVSQVTIIHPSKPVVGFCILTCDECTEPEFNEEFKEAKWFNIESLPDDILSLNKDILKIINLH